MRRTLPLASWASTLRREWEITLGFCGLMFIVLAHAAATEDAYITFRVVDNFVQGFGLRWNIDERVQVYTNPLWMLLHLPFYAVSGNIFAVTIALSLACTIAAVGAALIAFPRPWPSALAFLIAPLAISQSFVDYSTSGLENPLSHLLFALFGLALLRPDAPRFWLRVSLCCSLSLVNRLDTAIFYAPCVGWLVFSRWRDLRFKQCLLGSLPIVAWEIFAFVYYGFFFPNTKYAKLDESIAESQYLQHGFSYLINLITLEPISALLMVVAAIAVPLMALYRFGSKPIRPEMAAIGIGILLYSVYVVIVGGNHVSGRFWSLQVFAAIWVFYGQFSPQAFNIRLGFIATLLLWFKIVYPSPYAVLGMCDTCFAGKIRPTEIQVSLIGVMAGRDKIPTPDHREARVRKLSILPDIGMYGYEAGPVTHIVDYRGLADPLLARMPSNSSNIRKIGHLNRFLPKGYLHAIQYHNTEEMDPDLAKYYHALRTITSAPVFDKERMETVIRFNMGAYDELLAHFLPRYIRD
jgi:arabinofuranosyltransferase